MKFTTLDLLPQCPTTLLMDRKIKIKTLNLLSFLIRETIEALKLFLSNKFSLFDPHVGETSCQIRAYKLILLAFSLEKNKHSLEQEIIKLQGLHSLMMQHLAKLTVEPPTHSLENQRLMAQSESLETFLNERNLLIEVSWEAYFLALSYLLTKFKRVIHEDDTCIDYEKICHEMQIQRKLSKKIVHYYQTKLAEDSVNFIFSLLEDLPELNNSLAALIRSLNYLDDDNRSVLPCYLVMKILLAHMRKLKIPILIVSKIQIEDQAQLIPLLFLVSKEKKRFELVQRSFLPSPLTPCFVIHGVSIFNESKSEDFFIQSFLEVGLENIILGNMACHSQYSGKQLSNKSENPFPVLLEEIKRMPLGQSIIELCIIENMEKELLDMKLFATKLGCCQALPSLFFIKHIFCDTIANQLGKIQMKDSSEIHDIQIMQKTYS